jgi:hypothetical protein
VASSSFVKASVAEMAADLLLQLAAAKAVGSVV